jgi:hypothetical protein
MAPIKIIESTVIVQQTNVHIGTANFSYVKHPRCLSEYIELLRNMSSLDQIMLRAWWAAQNAFVDPILDGAVVLRQWQTDAGQVCRSDSVNFM